MGFHASKEKVKGHGKHNDFTVEKEITHSTYK